MDYCYGDGVLQNICCKMYELYYCWGCTDGQLPQFSSSWAPGQSTLPSHQYWSARQVVLLSPGWQGLSPYIHSVRKKPSMSVTYYLYFLSIYLKLLFVTFFSCTEPVSYLHHLYIRYFFNETLIVSVIWLYLSLYTLNTWIICIHITICLSPLIIVKFHCILVSYMFHSQ